MTWELTVINTHQRYVSVSRPRRFGKTMAADMICAYYDKDAESRELFAKRKLAQRDPIQTEEDELCWDTFIMASEPGMMDTMSAMLSRRIPITKN